jgi:hypothetical protein
MSRLAPWLHDKQAAPWPTPGTPPTHQSVQPNYGPLPGSVGGSANGHDFGRPERARRRKRYRIVRSAKPAED